ncbi:phage tail protein [Sideroxydans lithotrophicus]|uniref:Phage tail protein n=1 Tax=Sideroxydans lithotrophicus (strain ES-1) TaxID=580332 RepID=D5CT51_SIDLE|nr:phage tail protein [Sideroxydans lithotrophicus]ADE12137.1 conserved hypothetical protein [Sideroxydans lithotrophicus ES-1]
MLFQLGQLNATALQAPGVYPQIVPPKNRYINGVPTDIYAQVGIASWGPKNSPMVIGSPSDAQRLYGVQQVRKYDLASAIAIGFQVGAYNQRVVRVTDGTDSAATVNLMDTNATPAIGASVAGIYTGTVGNTITAGITAGTKQSTFKLTVTLPGYAPEVFDNIAGTGATFWQNLVSAVNNGQSGTRGPSQLVVASIGVGTAAPNVVTTYTLASGTDGTTTLTDSVLVGTDGTARTGMYALRGTGAQVLNLVDVTDQTQWTAINTFVLGEGMYYFGQGPAGASYSTVGTSLNTAGVDSYGCKILVGDWEYWQDNVNGQSRMMAPATFAAARCASQGPHLSTLNKPIAGITGTQRVNANQPYSNADIAGVVAARLDLISNPCPGGNYYGAQTGRNSSSNSATNGDNYTRMTNYLGMTLAQSFGWVVGALQTTDLRKTAKGSMDAFLSNLEQAGMIGDVNGGPAFAVQIDANNNPSNRVALGYLQADVQVKYLSVVFDFLINLEGGQSVQINLKQ